MKDGDRVQELLDKLIDSPTHPDTTHICPICGGELQVGFGAYKRGDKILFGVTANCKSCGEAIAIDYDGPPPGWMQAS